MEPQCARVARQSPRAVRVRRLRPRGRGAAAAHPGRDGRAAARRRSRSSRSARPTSSSATTRTRSRACSGCPRTPTRRPRRAARASGVRGRRLKAGACAARLCPGLNGGKKMVGVGGFEPPTSRSRTERSTKLSHTPTRGRSVPESGRGALQTAGVGLVRSHRRFGRKRRTPSLFGSQRAGDTQRVEERSAARGTGDTSQGEALKGESVRYATQGDSVFRRRTLCCTAACRRSRSRPSPSGS